MRDAATSDASRSELADRMAIDDLLTRYATALDRRDWDTWRTCFRADAHIDYTSAGGIAGSVDEVAAWLAQVMPFFAMTQHLVTNREIRLEGDRARARSAFFNPLGVADGNGGLSLYFDGGYYNDELVRTADGWRIVRRIEESAWSTRLHPLGAAKPG
jgi:3-phenylpropionate/cinnamic acid dioxygenase small subunit